MSGKSTGKPVTAAETAAEATAAAKAETPQAAKTAPAAQKYKVEKLRAACMKLFKVTTSTFDGAMYGHTEPEMTIEEAAAIINKWLGRKE